MSKLAVIRRGWCVAIAIAFLFLSQAFLTSPHSSSSFATPLLDAFGNPICITSTASKTDPASKSNQDTERGCDTLGCAAALQLPQHRAADVSTYLTPSISTGLTFPRLFETTPALPEHSPGSPRAPPASV